MQPQRPSPRVGAVLATALGVLLLAGVPGLAPARLSAEPAASIVQFTAITTHANSSMTVAEGFGPGVGVAPLNVSFFAWVSSGGVPPFNYSYAFGDGSRYSNTTTGNVSHLYSAVGVYNVTVVVTDAGNDTGGYTASIRAEATPLTFSVVSSPASGLIDLGQTADWSVRASGGGGGYTYYWYGSIPGCNFTTNSTFQNCTPDAAGNFGGFVGAADQYGLTSGLVPFGVDVGDAPLLSALTANPAAPDVNESLILSTSIVDFGWGYQVEEWTGLPPGCASANRTDLHCTPTSPGDFNVSVTITDEVGGFSRQNVHLTVNPDPTVTVHSSATTVDLGQMVYLRANASGGSGSYRYSWTLLPPGCTGANTSMIACTPATAGNYTITVGVVDSTGMAAKGAASIAIEVGHPPSLALSLPSPTIGISQFDNLTATVTGGVGSFQYVYFGLPPGCVTADRPALACQPNESGGFRITAEVTDSAAESAFANATLNVAVLPAIQSNGVPAPEFEILGAVATLEAAVIAALLVRKRGPARPPTPS